MNRGVGSIIGICGFLVLFAYKLCFAFDDGDFQYWNTESASWKINDDWKGQFEVEFRYGDDASNFYYQHSDLGFVYSGVVEWLDLGINYRQAFEEKSSIWRYENIPHFNATVKWKLLDFSLSNRARLEYKNREEADNYWRYRNKFTLKVPIKLTRLELEPYIADEIFYDFDKETLNRNRLYTGFNLKLFTNLKTDIFYLWQSSEKNDEWDDYHVLGTKLKFSF
ncbi:MAG: DUF2490 domain-containing protein [Candidatus Omnitrophica bacterium]|nr:DUF2490 domain-containing protein [Candidatus Omnitrophota bacterium]